MILLKLLMSLFYFKNIVWNADINIFIKQLKNKIANTINIIIFLKNNIVKTIFLSNH